jgi:hypothetical protein
MNATLLALAAVGAAVVTFTVATYEPSDPTGLGLAIGGIALFSGALAARVLVWLATRGRRRRERNAAIAPAVRRGISVGLAVGILAFLRAIDGLTIVTASFVVLAFALAEVALSARTTAVR